jgi:hypothetical protein
MCTASVSNASPTANQTVDVQVESNLPDTTVTATAHYKTTATTKTGSTDSAGNATVPFRIGSAMSGFTVEVDVAVGGATCTTSFTPQ